MYVCLRVHLHSPCRNGREVEESSTRTQNSLPPADKRCLNLKEHPFFVGGLNLARSVSLFVCVFAYPPHPTPQKAREKIQARGSGENLSLSPLLIQGTCR